VISLVLCLQPGLPAAAAAADVPLDVAALAMARRSESREKLVFRARQPGLPTPGAGSADDPTQPGSADGAHIEVVAEASSAAGAFVVPRGASAGRRAAGWTYRHRTLRFRNPDAPAPPSEVSSLVVGGKRLELVAKDVGVALDGSLGRVAVRITIGSIRYCARFDPTSSRRAHDEQNRYVVPNATDGLPDCSNEALGIPTPCDPTVRSIDVPDLAAPFGFERRFVLPQDIDPATDDFNGASHEIFMPNDPGIVVRDRLFVMLPGTNNMPGGFTQILRIAARAGYTAIGLVYDTEIAPEWCSGVGLSGPPLFACSDGFFREKLYGEPALNGITIDEPSSIVGRLRRLLPWLHGEYPSYGFDRFYDANGIRWERIVVGGFSQGAAMTGYLAKDRPLARAVFFAGGCDAWEDPPDFSHLMPWCFDPRQTPAERTFALMHTRDEPQEDMLIYDTFGMTALGGVANAATAAPDYCTTPHVLQTDLPSQMTQPDDHGQKVHLSVAHDSFMPLDGPIPVLAEDYWYLLTAE
jgi:hypothetical protein